ncbi:MAG: acyl dehydratase [Acidimicrobiales bacterium]|jgi:acyl dehydratase
MNAGTELEVIEREMSSERLIMYAGATWDWHKLHYDQRYASEVSLTAPIVDGQHYGGIFVEQALSAVHSSARVKAMKMRFRSMVFVGETIRVSGEVTSAEGAVLTMSQELKVDDRLCATAVTTVVLS